VTEKGNKKNVERQTIRVEVAGFLGVEKED
jgi:hypothetical protein